MTPAKSQASTRRGALRAVGEKYELTPWGGQHRSCEARGGMWIPTEAEVERHLPGGTLFVWNGKIVEAECGYSV